VVRPEGCTLANPNLTHCEDSRGLTFSPNKSTTWSTERLDNDGLFSLNTYYEGFLNLTGNAYYGFDTLTLGVPGSGLPSLDNQIIAGFATNNYWLGFLGLSPVSFNFSSQDDSTSLRDPQPSFLSELKNQSHIPSLSWAYTAGASYLDNPVFGSLVLGGYDSSRFEANNVSFAFAADFSRDLTVYLRSIAYDTLGSSLLLTESTPVFINSLVSHMWLPVEVCQRFEDAFNLTWNEAAQLYLVDDETHTRLSKLNPSFTFTLGHADNGDTDATIGITLPYAAFDLTGSPPFVDPSSKYFPLKRADRADQYTLGRVFLQGAYVIADYERQNFTVSQALFPDASKESNTTDIVGIAPLGAEKTATPVNGGDVAGGGGGGGGLSSGTIAGAVIGSVAGVLLIAFGVVYWLRRRKTASRNSVEARPYVDEKEHGPELDGEDAQLHELEYTRAKGSELDGAHTGLLELDPQAERKVEIAASAHALERYELP
jgi:hypothetical protein